MIENEALELAGAAIKHNKKLLEENKALLEDYQHMKLAADKAVDIAEKLLRENMRLSALAEAHRGAALEALDMLSIASPVHRQQIKSLMRRINVC